MDIKKFAELLNDAAAALCGGMLLGTSAEGNTVRCDYRMDEPLNQKKIRDIAEYVGNRRGAPYFEIISFSEVRTEDGAPAQSMTAAVFGTAEEREVFLLERETAANNDHRRLGSALGLYTTSDAAGQGLILWKPAGAALRGELERFCREAHVQNGYDWVYTPHIGRAALWETSGHLAAYSDIMYSPMDVDGEDYYVKPMSCPFHIAIYNSEPHSYRDLPVRLAELGTVYRYELSGTLHGLTRVRGFTQDDAHIICTPEQAEHEVDSALKFSLCILRAFGFDSFRAYVATMPEKHIGEEREWRSAEEALENAARRAGLDYERDEGGGAFYGPKIDLKLNDSLGREWQCGTVQFDFNLPGRFDMRYTGSDGAAHTPVMLHRALYGSIERFAALLTEHYSGAFPFWLSPLQFAVVPVRGEQAEYCKELEIELKRAGYRARADLSDSDMREKIKRAAEAKTPYILVAGGREAEKGGFSVRARGGESLGFFDMDGLASLVSAEAEKGRAQYNR